MAAEYKVPVLHKAPFRCAQSYNPTIHSPLFMDKFEYKILNISRAHLKKESFQTELMNILNELGDDSWELANVEGLNESSIFWKVSETVDILFLFKRKKL